jgi:hypothetical protein
MAAHLTRSSSPACMHATRVHGGPGARVAIQCGGGDTPLTVRECSTNWFGGFSVRMEGSPDMNRCTAPAPPSRASSPSPSACSALPSTPSSRYSPSPTTLWTFAPPPPAAARFFLPLRPPSPPMRHHLRHRRPLCPWQRRPRCRRRHPLCPRSGAAGRDSSLPSGAARRRCRWSVPPYRNRQRSRRQHRLQRLPRPSRRRARRAGTTGGPCRSTGATGRW